MFDFMEKSRDFPKLYFFIEMKKMRHFFHGIFHETEKRHNFRNFKESICIKSSDNRKNISHKTA